MFVGESAHALDAKNRAFVPKRFQEGLERETESGQLAAVLTRGFEGCLFLFSDGQFREVVSRLRRGAFDGAEARNMQRLFFANTHRATLDASGRILIPEKLKSAVGIQKEIVMVGVVDRVEIWPRERWEAFEQERSGEFDSLDGVLRLDGSGDVEGRGS